MGDSGERGGEVIKRDDTGQFTTIICSRTKRCTYCDKPHVRLCDYPRNDPNDGKTCDTPMCAIHSWKPEPGVDKDYCRFHRRIVEGPLREQKRKEELAANKRDTLVFIAHSKYAGFCKEKDCGAKWEEGEPMFWDTQTRQVYCNECGEALQ